MLPAQDQCAVNFGLSRDENCAGRAPHDAADRVSVRVNFGLLARIPLRGMGLFRSRDWH